MSAWTITIIDGLLTGLGLFALVRLRMYLGPSAGRRFGTWGRRTVWILLITAMVILAEFDLIWLRNRLEQSDATGTRWHYEAVYALIILAVGLVLVCGRVLRRRAAQSDKRETEGNKYDSC